MNTLFAVAFLAALAFANAGILVGHSPIVAGPVLAHSAVVAHSAPLVATPIVHSAAVPVVGHGIADTVVSGPSGVIATRENVVAPAVVAHGIHGVHGIHSVW